ncbi:MAG: hypothetical protein CBC38_05600 [Gammaproteobacteria bacterium TMED78]|nr:MAG: hypothetical protein CBC38_05600 [Gammaproteobacteria bacterium TMED78]|tara:strand:+ start:98358 stop:98897 length:540 start_codon:yes stop_codon:yes gene_type:complete
MKNNDDEKNLFNEAMKNVRPLNKDKSIFINNSSKIKKKIQSQRRKNINNNTSMMDIKISSNEIEQLGNEISFCRSGVSKKIFNKLKSGKYIIQSEIDLHGYTTRQAKIILKEFIRDSLINSFGCVRVVHGKGLGSGPEGPILKYYVQRWLGQWDEVLAFITARANDGGSGALYVLLKKN